MKTVKDLISKASFHLSSCMQPVIPLIIAASLVKLLYLIMNALCPADPTTMEVIRILGDVPFYFLPVTVAVSASRHFETDIFYTVGAACVLIAPDFIALMEQDLPLRFFGIPVIRGSYSYNVLPVILTAWVLSKIKPRIEKHFSPALRGSVFPFVMFVLIAVIEILVTAPAGSVIGMGIGRIFQFCSVHAGVLTWGLFAAMTCVLVPAGLHWIFVTTAITDIAAKGVDHGIMAGFLILTFALCGMDLAYAIRSRKPEDKAQYFSYFISCLLSGVSEPSLFGIALRDPKAMKALMLACIAPGIYQGITGIDCFIYSFPALPSFLIFHNPEDPMNLVHTGVIMALGFILGLIFTLLFVKETVETQAG